MRVTARVLLLEAAGQRGAVIGARMLVHRQGVVGAMAAEGHPAHRARGDLAKGLTGEKRCHDASAARVQAPRQ